MHGMIERGLMSRIVIEFSACDPLIVIPALDKLLNIVEARIVRSATDVSAGAATATHYVTLAGTNRQLWVIVQAAAHIESVTPETIRVYTQ